MSTFTKILEYFQKVFRGVNSCSETTEMFDKTTTETAIIETECVLYGKTQNNIYLTNSLLYVL